MAQWNAGFQYPMQTGFPGANPQFQPFQPPNPQFQQQQLPSPNNQFPQFLPSNPQFQQLPPPNNQFQPLQPQHTQFQQLQPQHTQFQQLQPQHTQFQQLQPQQHAQFQQQLQPPNATFTHAQQAPTTQQTSWTPTKAEKKDYDNIFRQWAQGAPFMSGPTALKVFGATGLPRDDLARIWTLADVEDRGKLNLAEFHIAMALIYRRLNGVELPEQLPPALIPPSRRDLDDSVDRVKDLLEKESRNHSPSTTDSPVSYLKNRSFNGPSPSFETTRDATIYKHSDSDQNTVYKPRSRHVDRDAIRSRDDEDSPSADLQDMKRRLGNTARMLDRAAEAQVQRTKEDEQLTQEMDDLKYRVKRVQEDLDYNSRGPSSISKENERRRLERELLTLMHERIPEVERKIKERDERKERERRQWARDRDRANDRDRAFARGDDRPYSRTDDRPYSRGDDRPYSRGDDRPYSRGDDRPRSRGDYARDRNDRPYSSSPKAATPVPPAPVPTPPKPAPSPAPALQATPSLASMTPEQKKAYLNEQARLRVQARMAALGVTTPSTTSPSLDTSVEERLQQEKKEAEEKAKAAEKQTEERERLRREKLESEKAVKEGKLTPGPPPHRAPTPTSTAPPPPAPTPKAATPVAPMPKAKVPPAPPKPRARPVAPKAVLAAAATPPVVVRVAAPNPPTPAPEPESDSEDEEMRAREEALRKAREERERTRLERQKKLKELEEKEAAAARENARLERQRKLKELEEQEAAAARLEEEQYRERMEALKAKAAAKPASPPVVVSVPRIQTTFPVIAPSPAVAKIPTPPPQVPSSVPAVSVTEKSTNPFSRLLKEGNSSSSPTPSVETNGAANPWATPPQKAPPAPSPPPTSPAPPSSAKTSYQTARSSAVDDDDDWGDLEEVDGDDDEVDSSDDEVAHSRSARADIAQKLFGAMVPRPVSTPPSASTSAPAVLASISGSASSPAPPAPPPPPAPAPPQPPTLAVAAAPAPAGDRNALFASIQGGKALRPTKTVDKSAPPISGKVLGGDSDVGPPSSHTFHAAQNPQPPIPDLHVSPPEDVGGSGSDAPLYSKSDNRQSVSWVAVRAADVGGSPVIVDRLPSTLEAEEEAEDIPESFDDIPAETTSNLMADVDKSIEHRVRSLYPFEGEGEEDLSFAENQMIVANPSKTGGDWWFGKLVTTGESGLFPKAYVETVQPRKAKAIFAYAGGNPDELTFDEGDTLDIVDTSEEEWWKAERNGAVLVVPAAYVELVEVHATSIQSVIKISEAQEGEESAVDDEDSDSSSSEYLSFENTEENEANDRAARERERQLVLEAAGFILQRDVGARPLAKGILKRRSALIASRGNAAGSKLEKDLPPIPPRTQPKPELETSLSSMATTATTTEPELSHEARLDDAYARYEAFKNRQATSNRLSVVSTESNLSVGGASSSSPAVSAGSSLSVTPHNNELARTESDGGWYPNLLHFLSRSRTPDVESRERRKSSATLNISGPISHQTPTTQGGSSTTIQQGTKVTQDTSDNPSFGMSWASLVDKTALDGIPPDERRRQESIFELINTEVAYVRDLQLIVEVFLSSMIPLLSTKEITVVFANIEDLLLTNTAFVSSLEQHQKECRLYVDKIGHILLSHIPNMGVYMEYCVNQSTAIKMLQSLRDSKPDLAEHLQRLRDENAAIRNLDLSSYLLAPMQRITRYPLLIKHILHYTEVGAEHNDVSAARDLSEGLLDNINETIREQENQETLRKISQNMWIGQGRLDLTAPTRNMGPRRLLKQGLLTKAKSGRKLQAFLCSDVLVLTDEGVTTLYRMPIPLAQAQVKDSKTRDETGFEILQDNFRRTEAVFLRAPSSRECQHWVQEILRASKKARHAEERAARKLGIH